MAASDDRRDQLSRRKALGIMGGVGAAALVGGCTRQQSEAAPPGVGRAAATAGQSGTSSLSCILTPEQTEGPYFVDERLERSDVRLDPTDGSVRPGVPLRLRMSVSRVDGETCTPLTGAVVDIWQCDALGIYSDVRDFQGLFDTRGRKFLRGYQVTDRDGRVEFVTVYPGWYTGRAVHIHFKIRLPAGTQRSHELTSQLYFDETVTDVVHSLPPYDGKGRRDTPNARDRLFRSGGDQLMLAVSREDEGYVGEYAIGMRMS